MGRPNEQNPLEYPPVTRLQYPVIFIWEYDESAGNVFPGKLCQIGKRPCAINPSLLQRIESSQTFNFGETIVLGSMDTQLGRYPLRDKVGGVEP
jgi:hypothetical protein